MPKLVNGELDDEAIHLTQRGLYVEPINYPLDESQNPKNGHEFIHFVRREVAAIFPEETKENFLMLAPKNLLQSIDSNRKINLKEWKNFEASFFSQLAIQLRSKKEQLVKKYPLKWFPSPQEEENCCLFCLGSEMCKKIFDDGDFENVEGNAPYLSIVLHLSQEEILTLLGYMSEWSNVIGMNHVISRWIYALLACLQKPVSEECEAFLEDLYDNCSAKTELCDKSEKNQLHLISTILKSYFCVKAYKVGTPLSRFQN